PEALGNQCISIQENTYSRAAKMNPSADPHELLALVWFTRAMARGNRLKGEERMLAAYSVTMQFACVPPPDNARALGIYFISQERPDIYQQVPKFQTELERLMGPVIAAGES